MQTDKSKRKQLVNYLRDSEKILDFRVLDAMSTVPRHAFVPADLQAYAYENRPLPIGGGQTISQPYIVARAAELLELKGTERLLEIGGGSGYQAAVLSLLVREVFIVEQDEELALQGAQRLRELGYSNIQVRSGDGKLGWPEHAPYDGILVSCAAPGCEPAWEEQLRPGGRLVIPVQHGEEQWMEVWVRGDSGWASRQKILPVRFVPLL